MEGSLPRLVKGIMALHVFPILASLFLSGCAILDLGGPG